MKKIEQVLLKLVYDEVITKGQAKEILHAIGPHVTVLKRTETVDGRPLRNRNSRMDIKDMAGRNCTFSLTGSLVDRDDLIGSKVEDKGDDLVITKTITIIRP